MSRWIKPTEAHLRAYLSDTELSNLRASLATEGAMDTVALVIDGAVDFVRGKIANNRTNSLARGSTIPKGLLRQCMAIAVMDSMSRAAASIIDASGARKAAADMAYKELDKVARGDKDSIRVEAPDADELDADYSSRWNLPGAMTVIETKRDAAEWTDTTMDGLI
jgi:hypothetical protein